MSVSSVKPPVSGSLPQLSGSSAKPGKRPAASGPGTSNVADTPAERAFQAQKEAEHRIEMAQKSADRAVEEKEAEADHMRKEAQVAYDHEVSLNEERLLAERSQGYERLRDLQRRNQAELNRVRREGEKQLTDAQNYYRDSTYKTSRDAESKLNETLTKNDMQLEIQRKVGAQELDAMRTQSRKEVERAMNEGAEKLENVVTGSNARVEQMEKNAFAAETNAQGAFEDSFRARTSHRESVLGQLEAAGSQQIKQIRQDTAQKLAAYSSRQDDPFYKLLDTGAELRDAGEHFELVARIPEHEQRHVSVSIKGDRLVLSGIRKNQETLELGPGRVRTSAAHQSYSESFPLDWPVNPKLLSKEFEGDTLIVRVPKVAAFNQAPAPHEPKAKPASVRAERPHFPDNLPGLTPSPKSGKTLS